MNILNLKNYFNKILVFYFPEKAGYWNSITDCTVTEKPKELGRYYLDFSSKAAYPGNFSKEEIPLYTYQDKMSIEHPTVIAQYAFGLYELYFRKNYSDQELKNKIIKMADWFVENAVDVKGGKGWLINIDYHPEYRLPYPWISALVQGEAISVLVRAAKINSNNKYEQIAYEALGPFEFEVKDGGLVNYFNSIPVYEECPTPHKPMIVLNGFIFSLFGLYDLYLLNQNQKAEKLFDQGIDSLKKLLPFFDIGNWTRYFLFDYPQKYYSSFTYHQLAVEQLKALYYLTNDDLFKEYSKRWNSYSSSFIKKTFALFKKSTDSNKINL